MFNLNSDEVEEYISNDYVLKCVFGALVLKFDVESLFNSYFHPELGVGLWLFGGVKHHKLFFLLDGAIASVNADKNEISESHTDSAVAFVGHLNVVE